MWPFLLSVISMDWIEKRMKFSESLKSNKDFQLVYKNGNSYANKHLVMYILNNNMDKNRIGISASKKVGNSVVRHRLARLVRESYRLKEEDFNSGFDIVIVVRVAAKDKTFRDMQSSLLHLGKLHNIVKR
ncbi:ribonuclease P protein component [Lachnotalea glycerini]|uniref:Ribonuclease P protein component n=2 Tax=Lachnotalea glycerini TaxID=1763509 RepID=A0A318EGW6_9FIRM|nr:ribonuclease P protein component [Lachnotalea glycerini]